MTNKLKVGEIIQCPGGQRYRVLKNRLHRLPGLSFIEKPENLPEETPENLPEETPEKLPEDMPSNPPEEVFDRRQKWAEFSAYMVDTYLNRPKGKYGTGGAFNDITFVGVRILIWNILKYATRLFEGGGKEKDFEKVAHYAQMAWMVKEKLGLKPPFIKAEVIGQTNPPPRENFSMRIRRIGINSIPGDEEMSEQEIETKEKYFSICLENTLRNAQMENLLLSSMKNFVDAQKMVSSIWVIGGGEINLKEAKIKRIVRKAWEDIDHRAINLRRHFGEFMDSPERSDQFKIALTSFEIIFGKSTDSESPIGVLKSKEIGEFSEVFKTIY